MGAILTSCDPQPEPGARVRDKVGRLWDCDDSNGYDARDWVLADGGVDADPESWTYVAGNFGPVELIDEGWGQL